jgi:light-regulated signal transduction histidine kinase (bacteriophytochrome)
LQFHDRIFGLFNKLNPQMEGTGIADLVKRIIEVHGGHLGGIIAEGATFLFTLPDQTH